MSQHWIDNLWYRKGFKEGIKMIDLTERNIFHSGNWYIVPIKKLVSAQYIKTHSVLVHHMPDPHSHRHYYWDYVDLKEECEFCKEGPPEDISTLWVLHNMDVPEFTRYM